MYRTKKIQNFFLRKIFWASELVKLQWFHCSTYCEKQSWAVIVGSAGTSHNHLIVVVQPLWWYIIMYLIRDLIIECGEELSGLSHLSLVWLELSHFHLLRTITFIAFTIWIITLSFVKDCHVYHLCDSDYGIIICVEIITIILYVTWIITFSLASWLSNLSLLWLQLSHSH